MVFGEEEAYKAYKHMQYWKDSEYVKARLLSPGQIRRFVYNKEGDKILDKRQKKQSVQHPRETRCGYPSIVEIALNDVSEWVIVKYITEHNYPLSMTPSKSRMHWSHAQSIGQTFSDSWYSLNSEGIGPSNIAWVCNAAGRWSEQNKTSRQCAAIIRIGRKNNVGKECLRIVKYF